MGIYGLTTYISENACEFLKDFKLHDCSVLIDGNAAASIIYGHYTKATHAFGGDYDKYANCVTEFIHLLKKCNIFPCFIFDGGYETRKLRTVVERIKQNVAICGQFKHKYKESKCFPLLLRDVFKEILRSIDVSVIQCDFEADQELMALGKLLHCPVISNDSDFYLCTVPYVPFASLELKAVRLSKRADSQHKYCLRCKMFNVDDLLNKFGGLEDKSLLPALSCVLGNDYIQQNTFNEFLGINPGVKLPSRIERIVKWLRGILHQQLAIDQIIRSLPKKHRTRIRKIVTKLFEDYNRNNSDLLPFIPEPVYLRHQCPENTILDASVIEGNHDLSTVTEKLSELTMLENEDISEPDGSIEILASEEYEIRDPDPDDEDDQDCGDADETFPISVNYTDTFPDWFLINFRSGLISPTVMNIKNFNRLFIPSQSEDYFNDPSHMIAIPILRLVIGIVLGTSSTSVKCHARLRAIIAGVHELSPIVELESGIRLPTLNTVQSMDTELRIRILLEGLGIRNTNTLKRLPAEWRLFFIALVYWLNSCDGVSITGCHIRAVVLCLLYLSVIDKKLGYTRTTRDLRIQANAVPNTEHSSDSVEDTLSQTDVSLSATKILQLCKREDCAVAASALLRYHQVDRNLLLTRKNFNLKLIHCFAQLQHCVQNVNLLNSVLNFPFIPSQIHLVFSGTFLYNLCNDLHKRKLSDGYITRTLLAKATSIIVLYRHLIQTLELFVSSPERSKSTEVVKKKKSRSRKNKTKATAAVKEDADEEKNVYLDSENIYSLLSII